MLLAMISAAIALPASQQPSAAVVVIGEERLDSSQLASFLLVLHDAGRQVLDADEVSLRLRGAPATCANDAAPSTTCNLPPDEEALTRMLRQASELEARFDSAGADALRQSVLDVFARTPRPSTRMRALAAEASLALASSALTSGNTRKARTIAEDSIRHFGDTPIDGVRYPPAVQRLFAEARDSVARGAAVELHVSADAPGYLLADGNELGVLSRELVVQLPAGNYRLWLKNEDGKLSLPYPVHLVRTPVSVAIDAAVDWHVSVGSQVHLACEPQACAELLLSLRRRLAVDELYGVRQEAGALQAARADAAGEHDFCAAQDSVDRGKPWLPNLGQLWQQHSAAMLSFGVGLACLGSGVGFGLSSHAQFTKAGASGIPQIQHHRLNSSGRRQAVAANALYGAGIAALGTAGVLLWWQW